jgi:transcriptional regulator with XRE-family HTH domain
MKAPELLKAWREKKNRTQGQAADELGVSQTSWADWERGVKSPRIEHALAIAKLTRGSVPVDAWAKPAKRDAA